MLAKLKRSAGIEVLIAIASIVFGILIGPILEAISSPFFDTLARATLSGILGLALLTIIAIVTLGIFANRQEKNLVEVSHELASIRRRLGLTVQFVHSPPNHSTGEVYKISRGIIEKAEKEILHLYYLRPQGSVEPTPKHSVETEAYQSEREKYTQAILDVVRRHKDDKFFYRRIFQFPEGETAKFTEDRVGKRWFEHTKAVLELAEANPDVAVIKKAPLFLQQNFFIVDQRYVIWGIDALDPEYEVPYYEGTLFFDDPHKEFIHYLQGYFLKVDARAVIMKKLPESGQGTDQNATAHQVAH